MPKVSVIIPCYNSERFLAECLGSVVAQTLRDIEIICVDDGSTDGSSQIIDSLAEKDSRLVVLRQKNQGSAIARNKALDAAKGEYVSFLDSDDLLVWCALERLYRQAEYYSLDMLNFEAITFYDHVELHNAFPHFRSMYKYKGNYPEPMDGRGLLSDILRNGEYCVTVWSGLFRRDFLEKNHIRFPEGIIHQDNIFTLRSLNAARRAWVRKEPLYFRRIREASVMTTKASLKNVYGFYTCLLEVEQMLIKEDSEFKSALEELHGIYKCLFWDRYHAAVACGEIDFRQNLFQGSSFQSGESEAAALSLFVASVLREEELVKKESALREIYERESGALREEASALKEENGALREQLNAFRLSNSWRIGRAVTFPLRKFRGGVRCAREHGVIYTFKHLMKKIANRCRRKLPPFPAEQADSHAGFRGSRTDKNAYPLSENDTAKY